MTKTAKLTAADLSQFTGSENCYRHRYADSMDPKGAPAASD